MSEYISKDAVIRLIKESYYNLEENMEDVWAMVSDVERIPTEDVVPRKDAVKAIRGYFAEELTKLPMEKLEDGEYIFTDSKAVNMILEHNKGVGEILKKM